MDEYFAHILAAGGKSNSLGRSSEVLAIILADKDRLEELYLCLFDDDAWIRMRAADVLEKVCRQHPEWIEPYIDRICLDLFVSSQPSIQWHLAQIFRIAKLTEKQRANVIIWLKSLIATINVDWIVSANVMDTLVVYVDRGWFDNDELLKLLHVQRGHRSKSVVRRANTLLESQ